MALTGYQTKLTMTPHLQEEALSRIGRSVKDLVLSYNGKNCLPRVRFRKTLMFLRACFDMIEASDKQKARAYAQ